MPDRSDKCPDEYIYFCMATLEAKLSRQPGPKLKELLPPGVHVDTQEYPLFVTWNKFDVPYDHHDHPFTSEGYDEEEPNLRGCIGTFASMQLEEGLEEFALTSALRDHRFSPIKSSELPFLECAVSLLTPMTPIPTPLSWTLATHGIHITFHSPTGTRHSGTYLPEVAPAQGWTKEETIRSLVRKAGYRGKVEEGDEVWNGMQVKVYESCKGKKSWGEFVEWKRGRGE